MKTRQCRHLKHSGWKRCSPANCFIPHSITIVNVKLITQHAVTESVLHQTSMERKEVVIQGKRTRTFLLLLLTANHLIGTEIKQVCNASISIWSSCSLLVKHSAVHCNTNTNSWSTSTPTVQTFPSQAQHVCV